MDLGWPQVWVLLLDTLGREPGQGHHMDFQLPVAPQRAATGEEQQPWSPFPMDHLLAAVVVVVLPVAVHRSLMVGERQKQVVVDPMGLRTCRLDTEK